MLRIRVTSRKRLLAATSCLAAVACAPSADAINSVQNEQARGDEQSSEQGRAVVRLNSGLNDDVVERNAPFELARHSGGLSGGRLTQLSGELTLRGTCLTLRGGQGEHALIWPRDAAIRRLADGQWAIALATPQGIRSLVVGDEMRVGGFGGARSVVQGVKILQDLASDCPDKAWVVQGIT